MGGIMKKVGIMPHALKKDALRAAGELASWLESRDVEVRLLTEDAQAIDHPELGAQRAEFLHELDLVISLGGDGTMLRAAAAAYEAGAPVVGINLGKKGFLTAMEEDCMLEGLEDVFSGRYLMQERMMLECSFEKEGSREVHYALNEVVLGKRELRRMIRLEVDINGRYFHYYAGDGVIFATPTGSTAYSLSSGGPMVDPRLDCIILTPICSHSLMDRSVIISPESQIEIVVERERVLPSLSMDGREEIGLPHGGRVLVRRAERRLKMIKREDYSFYNLLRDKFDFPVGGK